MLARSIRAVGAVSAALVALVLSHSIVYLVRYGSAYGEALQHAGHDTAWSIAVWSAAGLGVAIPIAALLQLARLARRAPGGSDPRSSASPLDRRTIAPRFVRSWVTTTTWLFVATGIALTIQENLERASVGLPAPGASLLLSEEYPFALPIVAIVAAAIGLLVALFRWRRDVLLGRLRGLRASHPVPATAAPRPVPADPRPAGSTLGRRGGLRAPPLTLPA